MMVTNGSNTKLDDQADIGYEEAKFSFNQPSTWSRSNAQRSENPFLVSEELEPEARVRKVDGALKIGEESDGENSRFSLSLDDLETRGKYSQSIRSRTRKPHGYDDNSSIYSFYSEAMYPEKDKEHDPKFEDYDTTKKLSPVLSPVSEVNIEAFLVDSKEMAPLLTEEPGPLELENGPKVPGIAPEMDKTAANKDRMERRKSRRASKHLSYAPKPTLAHRPKSLALPSYAITSNPAPNSSTSQLEVHSAASDLKPGFKRTKTLEAKLARKATMAVKGHNRSMTGSINPSNSMLDQVTSWEDAKSSWKQYRRMSRKTNKKGGQDDDDDRVLIGTRVGEGHANYTLMYNMLTGIRVSVSRCSAKPMRTLSMIDFQACNKLAFDVTGNELVPSSKYDFKFKDYAPNVFRQIRTIFNIDPAEYLMSLTHKYIVSELFSPGKSRSFFYYSRDYRFIIKTIHHVEHRFMRKILPEYFQYVKDNPDTLLTRIYGLHRVKIPYARKIHFVVMANIFPPNKDIHESYDLKGSTLGRVVEESVVASNPSIPMKDLNWVDRDRRFLLGPDKRKVFLDQLEKDARLLRKLKIMDYSLLVGVHFVDRGNQDRIRDRSLSVFQPDLNRAIQTSQASGKSVASAVRQTIAGADPVALDASGALSEVNHSMKDSCFYKDDGGFASTDNENRPQDVIYYMGIIDILTPYNYAKKVEHYWKSMSQDKLAISAVHPKVYATRFLTFLTQSVGTKEWESESSTSNEPSPNAQLRRRKLTIKKPTRQPTRRQS